MYVGPIVDLDRLIDNNWGQPWNNMESNRFDPFEGSNWSQYTKDEALRVDLYPSTCSNECIYLI